MNQLDFLHLILLHGFTNVTNVAATSFRLKQESDSCFILQANPDVLVRHAQTVYLGFRMSYSILPVLKILFINCRCRFHW